jgi:hypothetical protein
MCNFRAFQKKNLPIHLSLDNIHICMVIIDYVLRSTRQRTQSGWTVRKRSMGTNSEEIHIGEAVDLNVFGLFTSSIRVQNFGPL